MDTIVMPVALAVASALCFGLALVTGRIGLRTLDARSGAAISIPTATVLFVLASPVALDTAGWNVEALLVFAAVGVFFPAVVTLLTFRSNLELGPTVTSAVSGTAPLFAIGAAVLCLGERVPPSAAIAAAGVVVGVAVLSWRPDAAARGYRAKAFAWPLLGAIVRGFAQAGAKAGLLLWPNPFAAGLIGYLVSSGTVLAASRGRPERPRTRASSAWFALTGVLNGSAVLLMYEAYSGAPVAVVAPVVAAYPVFTALVSALVLREDRLNAHKAAGALVTVGAIVYLVSSR